MMNGQGMNNQMNGDQNLFMQMMMAQYQQQTGMQEISPQQQQLMANMMMNMNMGQNMMMQQNQPQDHTSKNEEGTNE